MTTATPFLMLAALTLAAPASAVDEDVGGPELTRYQEAVASAEAGSRTWTYNGRTYRIATRDDGYAAGRASVKPWTPPPGTVVALPREPGHATTVAPTATGGLGVFGILVVLAAVAGTVFVAVSVVTRRRQAEAEAGPVLMTATGLVVNIDDSNRVGTGLITLNKRDRPSTERRGHSAEVRVRTTEARRIKSDPLLEAVAEAEAAVGGPDPTPADAMEALEDPFEEPQPEAAPVDTVSDRIRQKHQSSTRRQTRIHRG